VALLRSKTHRHVQIAWYLASRSCRLMRARHVWQQSELQKDLMVQRDSALMLDCHASLVRCH
jgi:hypothetical protein